MEKKWERYFQNISEEDGKLVFSSTTFIFFFLPAVLLAYYICPKKLRNGVLLFFSLIFYSWGEPVYIVIMLFSTVFDYINGILIGNFKSKHVDRWAAAVLVNSVVINLGILCFFKYGNFFLDNVNRAFHTSVPLLDVALPIGISFYTFQTMSYTIDVYRGDAAVQKNIVSFGAYVTMFPQLVAGPIVQYKDIDRQLSDRTETAEGFSYGIRRFIEGLSKKVLLANNIGRVWEQISAQSPASLSAGEAWIGAAAFSFQIYFDFSGYSDMAIGLGEMFGFHFRENFAHPYCSKSITEFWRRWHISLGTWFREYIYIPMGGNRCGMMRQILNILTVWCLTGFWHGASWNFVLWGLYFGLLLMAEKLFLEKLLRKIPAWASHIYAVVLVMISWMIFAFEDVSKAGLYIKTMFGGGQAGIWNGNASYYLSANVLLIAVCALFSMNIAGYMKRLIEEMKICRMEKCRGKRGGKAAALTARCGAVFGIAVFAVMFLLSVCFLIGDSYNPFLYFRF